MAALPVSQPSLASPLVPAILEAACDVGCVPERVARDGVAVGAAGRHEARMGAVEAQHVHLLRKVDEDDVVARRHKAPPALPPRRAEERLPLLDHETHPLAVEAPRPRRRHGDAAEARRPHRRLGRRRSAVGAAREAAARRRLPHKIGRRQPRLSLPQPPAGRLEGEWGRPANRQPHLGQRAAGGRRKHAPVASPPPAPIERDSTREEEELPAGERPVLPRPSAEEAPPHCRRVGVGVRARVVRRGDRGCRILRLVRGGSQ
mmetsp:Transcript_15382/g.48070  ORF Transcript_15382/g.48070 Transcript_15382/m.48070 type:complete len:261 (-) Transcript_15382:149-931(-)